MEVNLHEVKSNILRGDLLLFRGAGIFSGFIRWASRSEYSHAAKADWWDEDLFCCEVREGLGGRAVTLASQVAKYPGQIDVYRTNPYSIRAYDANRAAAVMRNFAGCDYGWNNIAFAALIRLPHIAALFFKIKIDYVAERPGGGPPFCSMACSMADQAGGVDPVPNLSDQLTTPGDLARSHFYEKQFTLLGV
jgi:hypothetical protein